jgi:hypothetical protein
MRKKLDIVKLLIDNGADPNITADKVPFFKFTYLCRQTKIQLWKRAAKATLKY